MIENVISEFLGVGIGAAQGLIILAELGTAVVAIIYAGKKLIKHLSIQKEEIKSYINTKKEETDEKLTGLQNCLNGTRSKVNHIDEEVTRVRDNMKGLWEKTNKQGENIAGLTSVLKEHLKRPTKG